MKKVDLAYLAGLFDGEGCIHIAQTKGQKHKRGKGNELRIFLSSTDEWVCQTFKMAFGGSIWEYANSANTQQYSWQLACKKALPFLEILLPYLRLKRPQAEIAVAFQGAKKPRNVNNPTTDEEWALEEAQRILLKGMKVRKKIKELG